MEMNGIGMSMVSVKRLYVFSLTAISGNTQQCPDQGAILPALVQLDPFEGQRSKLLEQICSVVKSGQEQINWISSQNMKTFLWSYFRHFHKHMPMIHVPTWNITEVRPHLLLPMILVGAMYDGDVKTNGPQARSLRGVAEELAWDADKIRP
jgi:hypothetical protein